MYFAVRNKYDAEQFDVYKEGTGEQAGAIIYMETLPKDQVKHKYPVVQASFGGFHPYACPLCNTELAMEYKLLD